MIIIITPLYGCSDVSDERETDIDLTNLSQTVMQAEYQRILSNAESYVGQSIKLQGTYLPMIHDINNVSHYIIIIQGDDCCQMGFEFKRSDDHIFPDDYPVRNSLIRLTGVLETYKAQGSSFLIVSVDDFTVIKS